MNEGFDVDRAAAVVTLCLVALIGLVGIGALSWFLANCLREQHAKQECQASGHFIVVDAKTNAWRCAALDGRPERSP
jgi:hypothetical protein